ncbi:MAG: DUF456 domain-containing protein [Nocardioidaceae bacterium]|nr:DUF456 domain-containing protein [Nocardioidaceae bacterium]
MAWWGELLVGLVALIGVVGVVVPVLPGLLLVWAAVVCWGVVERGPTGWWVVVAATVIAAISQVVKYAVPGRRLQRAGVATRSLLIGGLAGVVGFFVLPVVGLVVGFVVGVYAAERSRLRDHAAAKTATRHALEAAGLSILLELAAALLIGGGWLVIMVAT